MILEYPNNQQLHVVSVADSKLLQLYAVLEYLNNIHIITQRSNKQLISVTERKLLQLLASCRSVIIAVAAVLHSGAGAVRADVGSGAIACSIFIVLVRRA